MTGIVGNLAQRLFHGTHDYIDAQFFVGSDFKFFQGRDATNQCNAAAGNDSLFHGSTGGVQGIFNAGLFLFHFGFGSSTDIYHGNTANEFGKTFLEFFTIVIGRGFFDLGTDLFYPAFQSFTFTGAVYNCGVVFIDGNAFGCTKVCKGQVLELDSQIFGNDLAAGENADVFEHCLAAITKARGLDCCDLQCAAQFIDNQCGQGFTVYIFRDDHQGFAHFGNLLQDGQQIFHVADLFLVDQDVGVFQRNDHFFRIGYKVGGEVTAVKLHTFNDLKGCIHAFGFFNGDDAFLADFIHSLGNDVADGFIVIGGNGADLGNFTLIFSGLAEFGKLLNCNFYGLIDTAFNGHGIVAGGNQFLAFFINGSCKHGCGCRTVTGHVACFAGHFLNHLGAHVLEFVCQFDFFGNCYAVFSYCR